MIKAIGKNFIVVCIQLFLLSLLVFFLAKLMPGDPLTSMITPQMDLETIERIREQYGFYDPWYIQYIHWVKNALHGDFGMSYTYQMPVFTLIGSRAFLTLYLSLIGVFFAYLIAIVLGVLAARYENTKIDYGVMLYSYISYAIPSFVLGLLLLFLFGYTLGWFPTSGSVDITLTEGSFMYYISRIWHLIQIGRAHV